MFGKNRYWEYAALTDQYYFAYHTETSNLILVPSYFPHSVDRNDLFLSTPIAIQRHGDNTFKYFLCINATSNGKDIVYLTYDTNRSPIINALRENGDIVIKASNANLLPIGIQGDTVYLEDTINALLVKLDLQSLQVQAYNVSDFYEFVSDLRINETPYSLFVGTSSIAYVDFDSQKYATWDFFNILSDFTCIQSYAFETDDKVYIVCDLNTGDVSTCPKKQILVICPKPFNINNFKNATFIELSNKFLALSPSFVSVYDINSKTAKCYKRSDIKDVLDKIVANETVIDTNSLYLNEFDLTETSSSYNLEKLDSFNPVTKDIIATQIPNLHFFDNESGVDLPQSLLFDSIEVPYSETYDGQIFKCDGSNCQQVNPKVKCQNRVHDLERIDNKFSNDPSIIESTGYYIYTYAYDSNKVTVLQPRITFPLKFIDCHASDDLTYFRSNYDDYEAYIHYDTLSMSIEAKDKQVLKEHTESPILNDNQREALIDQLSYDNNTYEIDLGNNLKLKTNISVVKPYIDYISISVTVRSPYNPYHPRFIDRDEDTLFEFEIPYSISFHHVFRPQPWFKKVVINNTEYQTHFVDDCTYVVQPKAIATSSTVSLYTDFGYVGDKNLSKEPVGNFYLSPYDDRVTYSYDFKPYGLITFDDNKFIAIKAKYPLQKLLNGYFDESKYGEVFTLVDDNDNSFTSDSNKVHMVDKDKICVYGGPSCQFIMFNDRDNPTSALVYNIQVNQSNYMPFIASNKIGYIDDYGIYVYDIANNEAKKISLDLSLPDYYTKVCYVMDNKLFIVPDFSGEFPDDQTVREVPITIVDLDDLTVTRYTIRSNDTHETATTCFVRYLDNQTLEIAFSTFNSFVTTRLVRYNISNKQATTVSSVIADRVYITETGNYAFIAFVADGSRDFVGILDNDTIKWYSSNYNSASTITLVDANGLFYINWGSLTPLTYYDSDPFHIGNSSDVTVTKQDINFQVQDANSDVQQKTYNIHFESELY